MRPLIAIALVVVSACGSSPTRKPGSCDGPCPASKIDHLVVILQENHTFDSYFARYCTAPTGSAPTCTSGPACCEAGPATDPAGAVPVLLDDTANGNYDPDHTQACELSEADGGKMDKYASGAGQCSNPGNVAYADGTTAETYWQLAGEGALADRYFQPVAGQSTSNDMFWARAQFVFLDNTYKPDAIGQQCAFGTTVMSFPGPTIGDLLDGAGVSWSSYAEGYQAMVDASKLNKCPKAPSDCPAGLNIYPCLYDAGDVPFNYFTNLADDPKVIRDYSQLQHDLDNLALPQFVFIRGTGYHSEHPGTSDTISDGEAFVKRTIDAVQNSQYAPDTLILVTWDEGGGFFDHIAPPGMGADGEPYGTRVPMIALGPFVAAGTISHAQMEHSSVVKFIEWNWLGQQTGQLAGRDAAVSGIGSLLDSSKTGVAVPP